MLEHPNPSGYFRYPVSEEPTNLLQTNIYATPGNDPTKRRPARRDLLVGFLPTHGVCSLDIGLAIILLRGLDTFDTKVKRF